MELMTLYGGIALLCALVALVRSPELPRYWPLLLIAAVPQIGLIHGIDIPWMVLVSAGCVALWGIANAGIAGLPIAAAGMLLNLLAMAAHGGRMPIAAELLVGMGQSIEPGSVLAGSKDIVVTTSPLLWLSDHLIIDSLGLIASPGDLIVLLSIIWWLFRSSAPQRRRDHACAAPASHPKSSAPAISARR